MNDMITKPYPTTGLEPFEAHKLMAALHLAAGLEQSGGATVAWSTASYMNRQSGFLVALGEPFTNNLAADIGGDELVFEVFDFVQLFFEAVGSQYVGAWRNPFSGQVELDVCEYHSNPVAARNAADENGQLAYWDIRNDREIFASLGLAAL
jgi:hypothetical protein